MRRCLVGKAHDMLSTFDNILRTLVLVRWWILLSVPRGWKDGEQEKQRYRAHDGSSFLRSECRWTGNTAGVLSWRHGLEQPYNLTRFCPPQPLIPLPRQSIHFGAQGNQVLDLLAYVLDLRAHQTADEAAARSSALA